MSARQADMSLDANTVDGAADGTAKSPVLAFNPLTWEDVQKKVSGIDVDGVLNALFGTRLIFQFEGARGFARVPSMDLVPESLWFVGDIHGDVLALLNSWEYIKQRSQECDKKPHVIFLGDIVDRGPHSHDSLLALFAMMVENPGQVGLIVGNHDIALGWDTSEHRFKSSVEPAEYADSLNLLLQDESGSRSGIEVGRETVAFMERCPRAVLLPDGLLVSHGGFPHSDLLASLQTPEDLNSEACLQDFVWLRASTRARRKIPNRSNRGCDFGSEDFAAFCEHMCALGVPVRRLLRGHDHYPERFCLHETSERYPVRTINTMCRWLDDEYSQAAPPIPCVAKYSPDQPPEIHRVEVRPEDVSKSFGLAGNE